MKSERCLYTLLHAPRERHEDLLHEFVTPVVRETVPSPDLDSLFFVRYSDPDWQLRFRVLGRPAWVDGPVRGLIERSLPPLRERGLVASWEFASYQREYDRYGGEEGMRLSERIFLHDSVAALDLIEAERSGSLARSRREYNLAFVERFLDLLGFDRERRIAFYRHGYAWALDGDWTADDLRVLEARYRGLREGLLALLAAGRGGDLEEFYGGAAAARIATGCLESLRPVVDELLSAHAASRIRQELVPLAWSLTHMHCNRLGLDPSAEAILRFFMCRLHEDEAIV